MKHAGPQALDELEPMRDLGPVALPNVVRVLGENLGTLRREPKGNRFGRVFVGSIEEAVSVGVRDPCPVRAYAPAPTTRSRP